MIPRYVRATGLVILLIFTMGLIFQLGPCGTIDTRTLGGADSIAAALNDAEQIVGGADTAAGTWHAFLWEKTSMTDLGTLGGPDSEAHDISQTIDPIIVGVSDLPHPLDANELVARAFLWQSGSMTDLGTLGGDGSEAWAVNDAGQVVGSAENVEKNWRAFLWQSGSMTDIGGPHDSQSCALDINNAGQIVGWLSCQDPPDNPENVSPAPSRQAFLWTSDGGTTVLGTLGGRNSAAYGISEDGHVVGWSDTSAGDPNDPWDPNRIAGRHVFVWHPDDGMRDLGTLGGPVAEAWGISSYGLTGFGVDANGVYDGVTWMWSGGLAPLGQPLSDEGPSLGYAINEDGGVVGSTMNEAGRQHGFLRRLPIFLGR